MNTVKHCFLMIFCFVTLTSCLGDSQSYAKDTLGNTKDQHYWFNLGGGFARVHDGLGEGEGGVSGGASFSYQNGGYLFSIRGVENAELKLHLLGNDSDTPDVVWDIGVLYGRVVKGSHGLASISGGPGIVGISKGKENSHYRLGIPIESQLFLTPTNMLGVGLCGFADLNSEKSFAGVLFCFQIGYLK